jgi:hypothetical protein
MSTKKCILRGIVRIIIVFIIGLLVLLSLDFVAGFVGVLLIDIYGILIERGKL